MKKRMMTVGIALGAGTLGYWLYREFKKSNHTVSGTVQVMGEDLNTGYESSQQALKRMASALKAGVKDWRQQSSIEQSAANPSAGGNGGTAIFTSAIQE